MALNLFDNVINEEALDKMTNDELELVLQILEKVK